jgi:hypothetical protein
VVGILHFSTRSVGLAGAGAAARSRGGGGITLAEGLRD